MDPFCCLRQGVTMQHSLAFNLLSSCLSFPSARTAPEWIAAPNSVQGGKVKQMSFTLLGSLP